MRYPEIDTQQDGVSAHHGIKFGCNTVSSHKVIKKYPMKNNTNMLHLQGKLLMLKISKEIG